METEAMLFLEEAGLDYSYLTARWEQRLSYSRDYQAEAQIRDEFIAKFGFAILDKATIDELRPFAPWLEIGAGSGYWTHEMRKAGMDVVATDSGEGKYRPVVKWTPWTPIDKIDGLAAILKYPKRSLLLCWPDMGKWPLEVLKAYGGRIVAYIGEGSGGCTADDQFHDLLTDRFTLIREVSIPHFSYIHDSLTIWQRRIVTAEPVAVQTSLRAVHEIIPE